MNCSRINHLDTRLCKYVQWRYASISASIPRSSILDSTYGNVIPSQYNLPKYDKEMSRVAESLRVRGVGSDLRLQAKRRKGIQGTIIKKNHKRSRFTTNY